MNLFFLRILPLVVGFFALIFSWWQWTHPLSYPWPLTWFLLMYILAAVALAYRHFSWKDALDKLAPSVLALSILCLAFLMGQTIYQQWILTILLAGISFFVLELTFLLTRAPARFPVNGLSHLNIGLIPIGGFFLATTMNGLLVFLRIPWWIVLASFSFFGAASFFLSAHPTAKMIHRSAWALLGMLVGLQAGILELLLPAGMIVHGALAAFLFLFPVRLRRYAYLPAPSMRTAWTEGVLAGVAFIAMLFVSRWA